MEMQGFPHIVIFAVKDIAVGEEIGYDYGGGDLVSSSSEKYFFATTATRVGACFSSLLVTFHPLGIAKLQ